MENFIEENKINEWKRLILNNPARLDQERDVIQRYGTLFNPANLDKLTKEDFKSFLLLKNNKHWEAIHRQSNIITQDMDKLKNALQILLDESKDINERLNFLFPPKKPGHIKGLGRAIVTPILMVMYPDKYGVWNTKSETGLIRMGLFPNFKSKDGFADKYIEINGILNELAKKYEVTLWQLDEIVGWIALGNPPILSSQNEVDESIDISEGEEIREKSLEEFGLESHLEDFLIENWDRLDLSKKYQVLEEDGDIIGQQYPTPIGRIDILAKSKDGKEWLVIELKKGKAGDQVVGQILRYMGWLKAEKAHTGEGIKGLIILGENDDKIKYALSSLADVSLMTYSVSFKLNQANK